MDARAQRDAPGSGTADLRLVERLLAGEESAYDAFAESFIPKLYRFAQSRASRSDEVEDIVQSTLAVAFEKLPGFRGDSSLLTWLCGICRFEISNRRRRAGRSPEVSMGVDSELLDLIERLHDDAETTLDDLQRRELRRSVHDVLDHLPEHYARALEWKYLHSLPVAEIAGRLELGDKAAESLLTRARGAFRDAFRELADSTRADSSRVVSFPGAESGAAP